VPIGSDSVQRDVERRETTRVTTKKLVASRVEGLAVVCGKHVKVRVGDFDVREERFTSLLLVTLGRIASYEAFVAPPHVHT
jgi:hypothetical protein